MLIIINYFLQVAPKSCFNSNCCVLTVLTLLRIDLINTGLIKRFFTALHCMQRGLCDRNAVCQSVCLSVTRVYCDKTNESSADILTPYERKIYLLFRTQTMVGGDVPLYLKFWVKLTQQASKRYKNGDFQSIFARSGSAVTLRKKFNYDYWEVAHKLSNEAYDEQRMFPLTNQRGPQRLQFFRFPYENGVCLKKVCYKVSLCENFQRQSFKALTYVSVYKWLVGDVPFYLKFWTKVTHPF